jgi:hypothetical protein
MADVTLYMAAYDWQPNVCVESLVAGTPTVTANNGGQAEHSPYVVRVDPVMRAKMATDGKVPRLKYNLVAPVLTKALQNGNNWVLNPDLLIENVAKRYAKVFHGVLG